MGHLFKQFLIGYNYHKGFLIKTPMRCTGASIKPESDIFKVTIGAPRTVKFSDTCCGHSEELTPENNSLYVISQNSQFYWSHRIDKESSDLSTRYSITLRSIGKNYKKNQQL